jgi:hypothetical protein
MLAGRAELAACDAGRGRHGGFEGAGRRGSHHQSGRAPTLPPPAARPPRAPPAPALAARRIRGAALDVFATEPLPPSSPLWGLPNAFLSPHCADRTKEFQFESLERFVDNVNRYAGGGELLAVVDKRSGY